ncbi:uncharacterized protein [Rutidosis leptorrhynchoides]|uniref:uncharacterized protein isoform X2 n=1 Tax=Rutidosis leptorrhynchoides TaxID=125765 RepID=UPI003A9A3DF0
MMDQQLELKHESTTNPCCSLWEDRFVKVQKKLQNVEKGRGNLKKALVLLEQQCDKMQDERIKLKKAYEEEKVKADNERKDKEKESAARVSLENEVSVLKSEILLFSQKGNSLPKHVDEELINLRGRVNDREKEVICLREQLQTKINVSATEKSRVDQELSNLKAYLNNVETEKEKLFKDLQKERARADSEKNRADEVLKTAKTEQDEIVSSEKSNNDLYSLKTEYQKLESEIGRLKLLLEKERKRADCERKIAETEKMNVNKVKEMLKLEQSRVNVEREKAEQFEHQLQKLKCEVDEARSKLDSEGSKLKEANKKKLEAEKKKTIKEKKKAEEQQTIAEMSTKHALEEKQRAVCLQQKLEECQKKYADLKKEMEEQIKQKSIEDLERDKEIDLKKAADMYKLQAMTEKSRADKLEQQLKNTKKTTKDTSTDKSAEMKLLKKRLKLEKARVKHANQVAEHEKNCKKAVEEELGQLKLEFARFSNRVGLCNCLAICNNGDETSVRKFLQPEFGKQPATPICAVTKPSEYFKPSLDSPAPSLPISGTCTESTSGTASKMEPLLNRKKLDCSALVSSMSSFSDRQLVGPQGNIHFSNSKELPKEADNNVNSPLRVKNKEGNTRKRKRLNAIESAEGNIRVSKLTKNVSALHGISGNSEEPLQEGTPIHQNEEPGLVAGDENGVAATRTCNNDVEIFEKIFNGDCMKLLNLDSEVEEEKYRIAVERPLSPTLPNIEIEIKPSDYSSRALVTRSCINPDQDSIVVMGPSDSGHKGITTVYGIESGSVYRDSLVVFQEFRDNESLSEISNATSNLSSQCCELSQSGYVFKKVVSGVSAVEILSPKKRVCVFFSLFLKSFSNIALIAFNHGDDGNFLNSLDIFSGQLKKVMSDVETKTVFTEIVDMDELISLIQNFIIKKKVTMLCNDVTEAPLHQLLLGAVLLASVCAAYDRINSICEASYAVSITSCSSNLTILHVFAYVCGDKLLADDENSLTMTSIKSLITYFETDNLLSGFRPCTKCPFSDGAVSMEELASFLLKKFGDCQMDKYAMTTCKLITESDDTLSDLSDVLSLLELVASKMSWGWVCENIISHLLKLLEVYVTEDSSTAVFLLLGQIARLGINGNGPHDAEVENIRVKLSSFISQTTSNKIGLPVQFAAVNALLGTIPISFQDVCKNSFANYSTATDSIRRWFSLLSDEHKSLSVKLLSADVV